MARDVYEQVAAELRGARRVLAITGAGMSADSGLPTYRGIGGLYEAQDTEEGIPIEDALSGAMFRRRPELTWRYLRQIETSCRGARHNAGHVALAALAGQVGSLVVLTQNVDGFHQQAGSRDVIDIHGDVHDLVCARRCGWGERVADYSTLADTPRCPSCGGLARPGVVLFGEMLPADRVDRLHAEMARGFDVVLTIGTTSLFPYIAGPVVQAARWGMATAEINPGESAVTEVVRYRIRERAAVALPRLLLACERPA